MNRPDLYDDSDPKHRDRVMRPEQFTQVIEAILSGKYSWACVLILRFAGYNPLHYIPYRTYNRLQKEHESRWQRSAHPTGAPLPAKSGPQLTDLAHLEVLEPPISVRGGRFEHWVGGPIPSFSDSRKRCLGLFG